MSPVHTVHIAPVDPGNPYQDLLARSLSALGLAVELRNLSLGKVLRGAPLSTCDVLHLHWLAPLYRAHCRAQTWLRSRLLLAGLRRFKKAGGTLVRTVHNLEPHEPLYPATDAWVSGQVHRLADAVIVHGPEAGTEYVQRFGQPRRLAVIPHGVYPASLAPMPAKAESRAYFGLPESRTVALVFGLPRPYKGYDRVAAALAALNQRNIHAVFAGKGYAEALGAPRAGATILSRFIPDWELPTLFAAADVLLLPYRECTTSGLATMGIGFGVPLVCSAVGPLPDLCEKGLGQCCDVDNPPALADAIARASAMPTGAAYRAARGSFLTERSWGELARRTGEVYGAGGRAGPPARAASSSSANQSR